MFAWFRANPKAKAFAAEKFAENACSQYAERMTAEISQLGQEALNKLLAMQDGASLDKKIVLTGASAQYKAMMSKQVLADMRKTLLAYLQDKLTSWAKSTQEDTPMSVNGSASDGKNNCPKAVPSSSKQHIQNTPSTAKTSAVFEDHDDVEMA